MFFLTTFPFDQKAIYNFLGTSGLLLCASAPLLRVIWKEDFSKLKMLYRLMHAVGDTVTVQGWNPEIQRPTEEKYPSALRSSKSTLFWKILSVDHPWQHPQECYLSTQYEICYTKPLPTHCRTMNMYLSTSSRWFFFFLIEIDLGIQKMLKMVSIPAQFWEVNLLNWICSRQVLVVCRILQHQKLFTEWPEEREGREGMNNTERLFLLLLEPQC